MIRDMEYLLNNVHNDRIKEYLKEALNCYSIGAYRACVIMTMIGGVHDLHNKIKDLAPSNKDIAKLEAEVTNLKDSLNPYERYLIDNCATPKIDILNQNEAKELNRCFDIRNDCAHPSDYYCSPETARYVFSTVIDILASKPILLGQQHINNLIEDINSDTFFPRNDLIEIQEIVISHLNMYSQRIYKPLAQKLSKQIANDSVHVNYNKNYFLANMAFKIQNDFNKIITPLFMSSKYNYDLMLMALAKESIIEYLSDENIKRFLCMLPSYTDTDHGFNQLIQNIILSERLSSSSFDNNIADYINAHYEQMSDNQCALWVSIMSSGQFNSKRDSLIKLYYKNQVLSHFSFTSQNYQQIFMLCNDPELYSSLINNISIRIADSNYTISNPATNELTQLSEDFIKQLSKDDIKHIIYRILKGHQGYGREVSNLFHQLESLFVFKCYVNMIIPTFDMQELNILMSYTLNDSTITEFVKKVNSEHVTFITTFTNCAEQYINDNGFFDWNAMILSNILNVLCYES